MSEACDGCGEYGLPMDDDGVFCHTCKYIDEYLELKEKVRKLREALEFYADTENYDSADISRATGNKVYDILLFDFTRNLKVKKDYAGKRAREALEATKESENGK